MDGNSDTLFILSKHVEHKPKGLPNGVLYISELAYEIKQKCNINYVFFQNIEKMNLTNYKYIILDSLLLNPSLNRFYPGDNFTHAQVVEKINKYFKNEIIIILMHDLHWWSFNSDICSQKIFADYINNIKKTLFEKNDIFYQNIKLLNDLNVTYFISLYNNQETENYVNNCKFINKFFINNYSEQIRYNNIKNINSQYNLVLYGASGNNPIIQAIYPLRNKIYNFIKTKNQKEYKIIDMDYYGNNKDIINNSLNQAWLACSTQSIYNYNVRKYFEIPVTKATLLCDANPDLLNIIGNNFVYINRHMNYEMIDNIVKYYIDNKEILCYLSYNCKTAMKKNNPPHSYISRLSSILYSIKNDNENMQCQLEYKVHKLNEKKFINYFYIKQEINHYVNGCIGVLSRNLEQINNFYPICQPDVYKQDIENYYIYLNECPIYFDKILNCGNIYKIKKYKLIDQIFISETLSYFKTHLIDNNNLFDYRYENIPTFYYGIWKDTIEMLKKNTEVKVLIFTGGDLTTYLNNIPQLINNKNTYIMSISKSISEILSKNNIRYVYFPYYKNLNINYIPNYQIKKTKILYYTSFNPITYNLDLILTLQKSLPQYEFIFTSNEKHIEVATRNRENLIKIFGLKKYEEIYNKIVVLKHDELINLIDQCFIYLRPTELDGLGQLAIECGLKGVKTLNNSIGLSNCIPFNKNKEQIIELINK